MKVLDKNIGDSNPPYILAEMACAHQGKYSLADKILDYVILSKADAIQFQIFNVENLVSCKHSFFKQSKDLELPFTDWKKLIIKAKTKELAVWCNVFDPVSVQFSAENGADALKIHSTDLSNPYMLDAVAATGLPLALAVGGSYEEEIVYAINYLKNKNLENIIIMHGYQGFPTAINDNNLKFIDTLKKKYGFPVGFQDHAEGNSEAAIWLPIMAIATGASLIEKHVTYDANLKDIDHQSSLSPERFINFVSQVKQAHQALGSEGLRDLSESEIIYRNKMKKMIVAAYTLPEGHKITLKDLNFLRAERLGMQAKDAEKIIGTKTTKLYDKGDVIDA